MAYLTKDIAQLDADRYVLYTKLKTAFTINIDKQTCNCGKENCIHLLKINRHIYHVSWTRTNRWKKNRGY